MTTKYTYKQHNRTLVHNVHSAVGKVFRIYSILCDKNLFLICTDREQFHTNVYNLSEKNICLYPQT